MNCINVSSLLSNTYLFCFNANATLANFISKTVCELIFVFLLLGIHRPIHLRMRDRHHHLMHGVFGHQRRYRIRSADNQWERHRSIPTVPLAADKHTA